MSTPFAAPARPTELRYRSAEKVLEIDFDDGLGCRLPAELLRVESPSPEKAEVLTDERGNPL